MPSTFDQLWWIYLEFQVCLNRVCVDRRSISYHTLWIFQFSSGTGYRHLEFLFCVSIHRWNYVIVEVVCHSALHCALMETCFHWCGSGWTTVKQWLNSFPDFPYYTWGSSSLFPYSLCCRSTEMYSWVAVLLAQ